jgi:signal transduction histidine kinase
VGLRAKLLLGLVLLLAPILGLLLAEYQEATARRRAIVRNDLMQTGQALALAVDATFDEAIAFGRAIAADPVVTGLDDRQLGPHLKRLVALYPQYTNLAVADSAGRLRAEAAADAADGTTSIADRDYFRRALATGRPTTIELVLGRRTGRPVSGVAVPVFDADGAPVGVLVISFDLDRLSARLTGLDLRPGQSIGLLDWTGRLAAAATWTGQPLELTWDERDLSALPAVRAALAGEAVWRPDFRNPTTGESLVLALVPTPRYGWLVAITWPSDLAFGPVEQAQRRQLVGFGCIALAALLGAALVATALSRQVGRLAGQVRAIGQGDLDRRVDLRTGDELEQLGRDVNAMAARLQATLRDLEAARQAAEAGRRAAEAARGDLLRFLGAVAHDLRSPVAAVKGSVGAVLANEPAGTPPAAHRLLANAEAAADRMDRLAGDLLDAARLGAGRFALRPRPVDLAVLARQAVEGQRAGAPRTEIALDAPDHLEGRWDPVRLAQVLHNLIGNATKYGAGHPVRVSVRRQGGQAVVRVADRGPGLRREDLPRLFQPFSRLASSDGFAGTGLGLYVSRGIVEAHGGRIWAESPGPGRGATFAFALPLPAGDAAG